MKYCLRFVTLLLLFAATPVLAQDAGDTLDNMDFETGTLGQPPPGWSWSERFENEGYAARLTDGNAHEGHQSLMLEHTDISKGGQFATLSKHLDAAPYQGMRVRLRAAVRAEIFGQQGSARLWLRVDRKNGERGFFDNMDARPITDGAWRIYEIVGDVAADAESIHFGTMLIGYGKSWTDDVTFEEIGEAPALVVEPARPVTERGLANLTAFTRLLGYVRYFHPSDEAADAGWEEVAIAGVRTVEEAADATDLAARLEALFRPLAPTVRVLADGARVAPLDASFPLENRGDLQLVRWNHYGVGTGNSQSMYRSTRSKQAIPEGFHPADIYGEETAYVAALGGGVTAMVPLALFADEEGTLPRGTGLEKPETTASPHTGNDRATRLAAVALAWNVFQHFYPYFDVVETDWEAALQTALARAAVDADEVAFKTTLQLMIAALHDGHGGVYGPGPARTHNPPFVWDWVEEQLVITHVVDSVETGVRRGDVVLAVDGVPAAEALAAAETLISGATPQWKRYRALNDLRMGPEGSALSLRVQSADGAPQTVTLQRTFDWANAPHDPRPETISEIEPGIYYVNLDQVTTEEFNAALLRLEQADGIVFDLRGYPRRIQPVFIQHLIQEPVQSAQWLIPETSRPDRTDVSFDDAGRWNLTPLAPYLAARRAFITDGRAISYAESCMGIIEHYHLAEIVGTPTAGTNGNVNPFTLPGGYRVTWTGMKVLKHDGARHHGVGILPTIPTPRTRRGVAEGRDELLERALEAVRE